MNNEEKILSLLDTIVTRLDSVDSRLDSVEAELQDVKGRVIHMENTHEQMLNLVLERQDFFDNEQASHAQRIRTLESTSTRHSIEITGLKSSR